MHAKYLGNTKSEMMHAKYFANIKSEIMYAKAEFNIQGLEAGALGSPETICC